MEGPWIICVMVLLFLFVYCCVCAYFRDEPARAMSEAVVHHSCVHGQLFIAAETTDTQLSRAKIRLTINYFDIKGNEYCLHPEEEIGAPPRILRYARSR